jgi:hypothetical protein
VKNGPQQQQFVPIPMFTQPPAQQASLNEPPARVLVALHFLKHATQKTMTQLAVNDVGFQEVEGQKLTEDEEWTHKAACKVLTDYFQGRFKLDRWEKGMQEEVRGGPGTVLNCLACSPGPPKPNCQMCRGTGTLIAYPSAY